MPEDHSETLSETVMHAWHVDHGAKMVPFGGWDMPVQYADGIIAEHLATRRGAGLFDVSHMGRYRITGAGAKAFLMAALTNTARALKPGEAQYTFIADDAGGAHNVLRGGALQREHGQVVALVDQLGVLREPRIEPVPVLGPVTGVDHQQEVFRRDLVEVGIVDGAAGIEGALPENKRNRLGLLTLNGHDIIAARTGYTGETVCFELMVPRDFAQDFWQRTIAAGATPVGLGARDSLRLEAGLPLYGHELGADPEGADIPIFANALAAFAVRPEGHGDYVGRAALERQRADFIAIRRRELAPPVADRVLKRLVQPIAAFTSKRPLRQGYKVFLGDRHVGWVTSGTTVPYARFYGEGILAQPTDEHDMRPIGLALIDSDVRYTSDRPVVLEIEDARGKRSEAELVEKNLWPVAPYGRPYTGFTAPPDPARTATADLAAEARSLAAAARANTGWRRRECINLIPSEQTTSTFVDTLCTADPASRYNEHNHLKALGPAGADVRYYKGTTFIMDKEEELKAALRAFFDCPNVEPRVISGQMANDTVYDALKQFRNRFRPGREPRPLSRVLVHDLNKGGHLSAQVGGALKNYVALDDTTGRPAVEHFPFQADNPHRIDAAATKAVIAETRPDLIVFGRSVIIQTEPVQEIADFVFEDFGRDNPERPLIMFDGAHVLGLLGPYYQKPLAEGADVVTGSTHKTFFGPQRGVVLGNVPPGSAFEPFWHHVEARAFPGHVSNHHLGTLLGLLGATHEMLAFRDDYPKQVIANAKAYARALAAEGLALEGDPACDYTETHQVLLRTARAGGERAASLLEANNVITNPQAYHDDLSFAAASGVRMGSQEMTRHGMKEADFAELAGLVAEIVRDGDDKPAGHWRDAVLALRARFTDMRYCFDA